MYTETRLVDVVSALGNVISNILGDNIPKWVENMKSALASFGRVVIEAAISQINIPDIMSQLTLGAELSQNFQSVYNVPQIDTSAIEAVQSLYNSSGIKMASEMAAQASRIKAMYEMPGADVLNSPVVRMTREMTAQADRMRDMCGISTIESIIATANAMNFYGKEFAGKMEETDSKILERLESFKLIEEEEQTETDPNNFGEENP